MDIGAEGEWITLLCLLYFIRNTNQLSRAIITSAAGAMDCTHTYQILFRLIPDEFFLWALVVILKSCHKSYLSSGSIFLWWLFKCKSNCSTRVFIFCPDHPWLPSSDIPKRHSIFFLRAISNCEAVHHIKGVWSTKETKKNQVFGMDYKVFVYIWYIRTGNLESMIVYLLFGIFFLSKLDFISWPIWLVFV